MNYILISGANVDLSRSLHMLNLLEPPMSTIYTGYIYVISISGSSSALIQLKRCRVRNLIHWQRWICILQSTVVSNCSIFTTAKIQIWIKNSICKQNQSFNCFQTNLDFHSYYFSQTDVGVHSKKKAEKSKKIEKAISNSHLNREK